ncbi:hypothetical protein [Chitinophaga sp. HK235]|uniref:hypothetical protein n=1 Tax=Chitinophaga sp. HK235 TaxID=2952571 RepID=UPI001BA446F8|nr:hypothetical protein [Chitinophaga sp. HK235]
MRAFWVATIIILLSIQGDCQILNKEILTKNETQNGVFLKFSYSAKNSYGVVRLILKKNNTYYYSVNTCATHGVSEGKWRMFKDVLILESALQMDNIAAKISYDESGRFIDSFDIAVVKNVKNELLTEAFVLINNDSIKCLPMIGRYNGSFDRINRVKIVFENGMSSKWIVVKKGTKKVLLTILTDAIIDNYIVLNKLKFKLRGDFLIQQ